MATASRALPVHAGQAPALRLTRRGRLAVAVGLLAVTTAVVLAMGLRSAAAGGGADPVPTRTVQVAPGDTLWGIAATVSGPGEVRETVFRIKELNSMTGAALRAGERIAVPVAQP
ncbi:MAG: LysM peptidoglycan-binding domain-containing protein [Nocardioidaceae bacterium]